MDTFLPDNNILTPLEFTRLFKEIRGTKDRHFKASIESRFLEKRICVFDIENLRPIKLDKVYQVIEIKTPIKLVLE